MPDNNSTSSTSVNRRQFTKISVAAAASAAMATDAAGSATPPGSSLVDDFGRADSFYHGHGWESLNPGYWKLEGSALRRRIHTRGDKARLTGFPFHAYMETDYETRPPYGMIWRRDWKLRGNYHITISATVRALPNKNPEPGYGLMGICFGGRTLFESWNGGGREGDACWYAAWRDDGSFGVYDHTTDAAKTVQPGSAKKGPDLQAGDQVTIEVAVSGGDATTADLTATLTAKGGSTQVVCSKVERAKFIEGYFGLVGRGELDFEVNEVRLLAQENKPLNEPVNELQVCYALGDSLKQVDGRWYCRFIAIFRQEGRQAQIRISTSEKPAGGWESVPFAGAVADIVTNDFRRATAVIDCLLPANPAETEMYFTVWKDGEDVTDDPRPRAQKYVGRLPQLRAPYRLCGLSCHAISGRKPGMEHTGKYQENWIHDQPQRDAFIYTEHFEFQVMVWEDDVWYLELVLYTPSTDDAYKIITTTLGNPMTRWQMMRHWNTLNPGDHDHGMDDVKGPEQIAIRSQPGLGQDIEYMQRNFQIVSHLISGDDSPSGTENPKRWRRWKMPDGDFSLLIVDSRLWRTSQDTHIWEREGWSGKGHIYDRKDPTRSLLGEEQFAWLQEVIRTDSSALLCVSGINGMHTIWQPSAEAEQRDRVAADYAGWVKAGCDRVIELLSSREGIVSVYGDVHIGSIARNRQAGLYECSFGPIGRTGGRRLKHDFGPRMKDYDGRELDIIALYHQDYESPDLKRQSKPGYWNFLEMYFDTREADANIQLRVRRLDEPPNPEGQGGGWVNVKASTTGRPIDSRLPEFTTLPNAHVKFSTADGRPIRGARSRADGRVPVSGLVEVSSGKKVLMTAFDGRSADAQLLETLPLS